MKTKTITAAELATRARASVVSCGPQPWWVTHPMAEQIKTCLLDGVSCTGILRVLQAEGITDVTINKLQKFKQTLDLARRTAAARRK